MKKIITAVAALFVISTAAYAEDAYPAYTKDKSAWWVSTILLPPTLVLDGVGRAIEVSGKDQGAFKPLHRATEGIAKNALQGLCGAPAVGSVCK